MSSIIVSGDTSGAITVAAPAVAGTYTNTLPKITGTLSTLDSGTAVSASGTSVDFTIPANVKRITVQIVNLGYAAAGAGVLRIGSGSLTTSGYSGGVTGTSTAPAVNVSAVTTGFGTLSTSAASGTTTITGQMVITNVTGNLWVATGSSIRIGDSTFNTFNGYITLGGTLDRLSLVATTSTFNAGTINILYE